MNDDAPGRMFIWCTSPCLVTVYFLGGEELAKICSKSVCRTQPALHTSLLLQYTTVISAIVNQLNINEDVPGRMFVRWTPQNLVQVNFVGGVELAKTCSESPRRKQPELHPSLPVQYTKRVNQLNSNEDAPGWMFVRWTPPSLYQSTSWVEWSLQKFVPRAFVEHSLSYTPVCFSSIL